MTASQQSSRLVHKPKSITPTRLMYVYVHTNFHTRRKEVDNKCLNADKALTRELNVNINRPYLFIDNNDKTVGMRWYVCQPYKFKSENQFESERLANSISNCTCSGVGPIRRWWLSKPIWTANRVEYDWCLLFGGKVSVKEPHVCRLLFGGFRRVWSSFMQMRFFFRNLSHFKQ
jgi:hypothetical protein